MMPEGSQPVTVGLKKKQLLYCVYMDLDMLARGGTVTATVSPK
jgi:hypothetical protein